EVGAELGVDVTALEPAGRHPGTRCRRNEGGLQLGDHPAVDVVDSRDAAGLPQERCIGAAHIGPGVLVAGAAGGALDIEAPGHLAATTTPAQRLERDPDLGLPAERGKLAIALPDEIGVAVGGARAEARRETTFGADTIVLHAERVDPEEVGPALVVEGVEEQRDLVVAADVVAVR